MSTVTPPSPVSAAAVSARRMPWLRPGRIERYLLGELATPFLLTFLVASLVLVSGEFLQEIIDKWLNRGLSLDLAGQVLFFLLPPLLIFTLPVAMLLAILVTFGRLSEDHEIVALQAAGVSWGRLFAPLLAIGLAASLFNCWLANTIIPRFRYDSREFIVRAMLTHPTLLLEARTWLREGATGMHVWIGEIDDDAGELRDLRIYREDPRGARQTITAAAGRVDIDAESGDIVLELRNGGMHQASATDPESYDLLQFKRVRIPFPVYALQRAVQRAGADKLSEQTLGELLRRARDAGGISRRIWTEIGARTALPFACLTFVLIGAPLSIRPHRSVRMYGAALCLALVVAYYLVYSLGEVLARQRILHPLVGLWLPNVLLGGSGTVAMSRLWRR